ncbi:hypothetical protein CJO81_03125 [Ralstonia solanacearum]|uniref:hypothetical protein n=1 Tax=Ralstonia pseudosolanacearum TaxID=1310165 RepID=UPI000E596B4E|nr:hypothetical protein [Ralstonia pseudosolanacearum]AXV99837.1 hypothetical protein CJO81_03125 [Ralstonia solanacearum]AXW27327.1 hypothetical protein CJO87_03120 [Ralstonia solanacearum]NJZ70799.1 hypothetical protein [Ralstonia solanacearum]NKF82216.1 hypothetical protein [Ralstonia solanacearum]UYR06906.1 hypothetical protein NQS38_00685 [Ralstonia pseudosolanacearum]
MESNLIALKLFLDELGQTAKIDTVDDRMSLQKVIYLGQIFGADLGYRYSWYVRGPYSPSLTQDYYALSGAIAAGDKSYEARALNDRLRNCLAGAKNLLQKPPGVTLATPQWFELIASLDYLKRVSKRSDTDAATVVRAQKPHLVPWIAAGLGHLAQYAPQY